MEKLDDTGRRACVGVGQGKMIEAIDGEYEVAKPSLQAECASKCGHLVGPLS